MAQAVNQQIVPGIQQPVINVQQQILQNEDNNCIQLFRAAMGIVSILCGIILIVYPLTTPDPCQEYNWQCWGNVNAVIAIIAGSVGVLSGMTNNKCVNIGFSILAFIAIITSVGLCIYHATFAASDSDTGLFVLTGILACECFACIIGLSLTCRCMTKCCVKKPDRVDVNRPDVVPPANEMAVNTANRPPAKAPTKAPEHRPPTKAIPLPDMFFTA
ncbi:uncharacterized protein [Apostichopus japonicus]|uniref:uncharacterized protein isoform X2 n=1 Tax=Stichopus japonicus TaxID=307972 RepID=UPI003AB22CBA